MYYSKTVLHQIDHTIIVSKTYINESVWRGTGCDVRVSDLLSRHSTTWATHPAVFSLVTLEIGSCFLLRLSWTVTFLFYASCHSWDDRSVPLFWALLPLRWSFRNISLLAGTVIVLISTRIRAWASNSWLLYSFLANFYFSSDVSLLYSLLHIVARFGYVLEFPTLLSRVSHLPLIWVWNWE
jgi:hypothetical protein